MDETNILAHPSIIQIVIRHLLHDKYCFGPWSTVLNKRDNGPCPHSTYTLMGRAKSILLICYGKYQDGSNQEMQEGKLTQPGSAEKASWRRWLHAACSNPPKQHMCFLAGCLSSPTLLLCPPVSEQLQQWRRRRIEAAGEECQVGGHRLHHHWPSHHRYFLCSSLLKEVSRLFKNPSSCEMPFLEFLLQSVRIG